MEQKPPKILVSTITSVPKEWVITHISKFFSHTEVCDGEIKSNIKIEYVGNYEHEASFDDAGIEINFICNKCGSSHYSNLPSNLDELNEFLTQVIYKL
jgi:hypothetical protein